MKKGYKPWIVEYRYFKSTGEAYHWRQFDKFKTREEAEAIMAQKKKCFPFCEFRAIGPSK